MLSDASILEQLLSGVRLEPRPYQRRIVDKASGLFCEKNLRSVLIDSPTGSGKTVMGLLIARLMQLKLGVSVGWVAMRRNLLEQAREENLRRAVGLDGHWISMFDKSPPQGLDMLVVDEAQHDAAGSMAHLHNVVRPRFILGLSATPFRADRVKLCFDTVIKDAGIHRLIQDGYLSPFHHYTIPRYTPEAVADFYARDKERWGKSILYFHTLDQCAEAARSLRKAGVRCDVVSGSSDREAQIDAFRSGALEVLVNCQVLAEGFDCPELKTVFCRPSSRGVTVQMCGRVFRKHAGTPVKQVVQCMETRWPILRTADAARQFSWVDGEWRSLQINERIEEISHRTIRTLAQTQTELPAFLVNSHRRRWRNSFQASRPMGSFDASLDVE